MKKYIFIPLFLLLTLSCARKVYVPVESVRTEYRDRVKNSLRIDSIIQRDSVTVFISGDTVVVDRWRDRVKWRDREVHDTLTLIRRDTIAAPYPVEKKLTAWEKVKIDFGEVALVIAILGVPFIIIWLARKFRK